MFAEKGFAGARMDDIARRAGVTKGTIYLYFENKEAVFKTLVRDSIGATLAGVTANARDFEGSAKDLLRFALGAMAHLLTTSDRVVLPKIIIAESGNFPELARFYREEIIDKGLALMSGLIERGIAQGEFRKVPVAACRAALHRAGAAGRDVAHDLRALRCRALRLQGPDRHASRRAVCPEQLFLPPMPDTKIVSRKSFTRAQRYVDRFQRCDHDTNGGIVLYNAARSKMKLSGSIVQAINFTRIHTPLCGT